MQTLNINKIRRSPGGRGRISPRKRISVPSALVDFVELLLYEYFERGIEIKKTQDSVSVCIKLKDSLE